MRIIDPKTNQPFASMGRASGFGGQLREWTPPLQMADAALLPKMKLNTARTDDLTRHHGYAAGGVQMHVDNVVGHMFRLSYKPMWRQLGITEADARDMSRDVEAAWREYAEDPVGCYLDAERRRTFTMMVREGVGTHVSVGEIMASAEWIRRPGTPFQTAISMVAPKRVSNPNNAGNTTALRGGVELDYYGAAVAYHVLQPSSYDGLQQLDFGTWRRVPRETRWGRTQFIHQFTPSEDGQVRGANRFMAVMEQLHMVDKLQLTHLQNAIVNAMYAATIESELDGATAMEFIAGGQSTTANLQNWLMTVADYHQGAQIKMNGVKVPHLFPGEKLNVRSPGKADNGFSALESSILRYTAAGMGWSYEQLARDYSKVNYSSARASIMESWRFFMGERKVTASGFANQVFSLWLEEAFSKKLITPPSTATATFWQRKAAWCNADWIGSGRLAIDGLKEVKEAILRIESGLSSYEKECALMGEDYQELFAQQVREMAERKAEGLPPPSWVQAMALAPDEAESQGNQENQS